MYILDRAVNNLARSAAAAKKKKKKKAKYIPESHKKKKKKPPENLLGKSLKPVAHDVRNRRSIAAHVHQPCPPTFDFHVRRRSKLCAQGWRWSRPPAVERRVWPRRPLQISPRVMLAEGFAVDLVVVVAEGAVAFLHRISVNIVFGGITAGRGGGKLTTHVKHPGWKRSLCTVSRHGPSMP